PGRSPRSTQGSGFEPGRVVTQVIGVGRRILKEIPVRIDGELQVIVLNRTPNRLTVEADQNRRRAAHENLRWIGFQTFDILGGDSALIDQGQDAVEPNRAIVIGDGLIDLSDNLLRLFLGQRLKVCLRDLDRGKLYQSLSQGD